MKKTLALILAVLMVVALFAGCGKGADTPTTPNTDTPSTGAEGTGTPDAPVEEASPYNFAKGKFEFNEAGYVDVAYEYELPLSTTDETFVYWTGCWTPEYLPEGGMRELETLAYIEELTGVHLEYEVIPAESKSQNMSVLLASDDLRDIMDGGMTYYTGTSRSAIDDGWFINFYDYRDYMPNYLFNLWDRDDIDVLKYGRIDDVTWPAMYGMLIDPAPGSGYMLRQDIMDDLGLGKAEDVKTFDQWYDVLTAFKNNGMSFPLGIYKTIELTAGASFSGFNTSCAITEYGLPGAKIIDGKVQYSATTQDDYDLLTLLNKWYSEGLIDPNYASYGDNNAMSNAIANGDIGCVVFNPSEVAAWEASISDPDATFMPTPRIRKTEDQILQYGQKLSNFHYGSATVSAKCENIELMCTWLDWKWSPFGIEVDNWGVEGLIYFINEDGEKQLTDFVLNNPDGIDTAWLMVMYTNDGLRQPCLNMHRRMYAYPGGEIFLQMFDTWAVEDYGGEYDFPTGVTYTEEQSDELNTLSSDMITYINETYFAFLDGSKPLTEWDGYIAQLENMGIGRCREIAQEALDAYYA